MKKFEQKSIDQASDAEVRDYASTFLGIPVEGVSDDQVRAKVRSASDSDMIYVKLVELLDPLTGAPPPDPDVSGEDRGSRGLVGSLGHDDPKVRLTLHAEERDGVIMTRHKEIGVNGVVWLIKRGTSVEVPYRVYEALNNALRNNVRHDDEGNVLEQFVHNTPFNIETMPPAAEIAAWQERTRDLEMA